MYPPAGRITTVFNQTKIDFYTDIEFTCYNVNYNGCVSLEINKRLEFWQGGKRGVVINADLRHRPKFEDVLPEIDDRLRVEKCNGYTKLTASVDSETHFSLGQVPDCEQSMAFFRNNAFWMRPETKQGGISFPAGKQGVALQYQRSDGLHVVVRPVSGYLYGEGKLQAYTLNELEIRVATGYDLTKAWSSLFDNPVAYNGWVEFMYCTWNGLGMSLTADKLIDMLQELSGNGVQLPGVIIDDGWQHATKQRHLLGWEAKPELGSTLKELVSRIKSEFGITEVGVWSALTGGYWRGIEPGCLTEYEQVEYTIQGDKVLLAKDPYKYFDDYFKFLSESGITCVKIDNEGDLARDYIPQQVLDDHVYAIRAGAEKYFNNKIIYCMAMAQGIMNKIKGGVLRNSDDFFPDQPKSHHWHVYTNFCCAQFTRNYDCVLDFDMFQTEMPGNFASLHAAARCISGGPIYFTDKPGEHDFPLINSFSAFNDKGQNCVIEFASPTLEYPYPSFVESLRVKNRDILGLFNTTDTEVEETVVGIGRSYSGILFKKHHTFKLKPGEWEMVSLPRMMRTDPLGPGIGMLGKLDHIAGIGALHNIWVSTDELGCEIKFTGPYGILFESVPQTIEAFVQTAAESVQCKVQIQQEGLVVVHVEDQGDLVVKFK